MHHPPSNSLNLPWITLLHKLSHSTTNLHNHLPSKAWLKTSKLLNPNPPNFLSLQTFDQLKRCIFVLSPKSPHKRFLCIFSSLILTFLGRPQRDIKPSYLPKETIYTLESLPLHGVPFYSFLLVQILLLLFLLKTLDWSKGLSNDTMDFITFSHPLPFKPYGIITKNYVLSWTPKYTGINPWYSVSPLIHTLLISP